MKLVCLLKVRTQTQEHTSCDDLSQPMASSSDAVLKKKQNKKKTTIDLDLNVKHLSTLNLKAHFEPLTLSLTFYLL